MSNHAKCPQCQEPITPLDTVEGICSACWRKNNIGEQTMEHENAKVWEKLPTETLVNEQERIHLELEDLTSRAETIGEILMSREVDKENY